MSKYPIVARTRALVRPLLASGLLFAGSACTLEHPEFVPPATTCSSTVMNLETGFSRIISNSLSPFIRGIYSCNLEASTEVWDRFVGGHLEELCAPGAATTEAVRAQFCRPNAWCRVPRSTVCTGPLVPLAHCSRIPLSSALPECPEILPGGARPAVDRSPIDFGTVPVGELRTATVRVTNGGDGQLTVYVPVLEQLPGDASSFASFPDMVPMTDCGPNPALPAEVRAGGAILGVGGRSSCSISVRFQPNFAGAKRMRLLIPNSGMPASLRVDVMGQGQAGSVRFSSLDPRAPRPAVCFNVAPEMTADGLCRTRSFNVTATGATVRVREVLVPAGYRLLAPTTVPVIIARDSTMTFTLRTCAASPAPATLRLNTNADPGMLSLDLEPPSSGCMP